MPAGIKSMSPLEPRRRSYKGYNVASNALVLLDKKRISREMRTLCFFGIYFLRKKKYSNAEELHREFIELYRKNRIKFMPDRGATAKIVPLLVSAGVLVKDPAFEQPVVKEPEPSLPERARRMSSGEKRVGGRITQRRLLKDAYVKLESLRIPVGVSERSSLGKKKYPLREPTPNEKIVLRMLLDRLVSTEPLHEVIVGLVRELNAQGIYDDYSSSAEGPKDGAPLSRQNIKREVKGFRESKINLFIRLLQVRRIISIK